MDQVYKTCKEMFLQRGYVLTDCQDDQIIATKPDGQYCYAFLTDIEKFNTNKATEYINLMHDLKINHCVVVYTDTVTSSVKKLINKIPNENIEEDMLKIELFSKDELQMNITKHVLQPQFSKLSAVQASIFKEKYGTNIPVMLHSDPISKFYAFEEGDVIKIKRKSGYITYRVVVAEI